LISPERLAGLLPALNDPEVRKYIYMKGFAIVFQVLII